MKEYIVPIYDDSQDHDEIFVGYIRENATEIVRCKDCIYYDSTELMGRPYNFCGCSEGHYDQIVDPESEYCSRGERQTDETD